MPSGGSMACAGIIMIILGIAALGMYGYIVRISNNSSSSDPNVPIVLAGNSIPTISPTSSGLVGTTTGSPTGGGGNPPTGGGNPPPTTNTPTTIAPTVLDPCDTTLVCCNGMPELCDQPVNNVLFATLHNAMATTEDDFTGARNHNLGLEKAVEAGFRGVNLDICNCDGELVFCHGLCFFGSKPITPTLEFFVDFLNDHPREVFLVTLQIDSNADEPVDLQEFYALLEATPGLTDYMYVHPPPGEGDPDADGWPTLSWLIENQKRMIFFHFNGPNNCDPYDCPPGLHYYFDYAAETEFSFNTLEDLDNTETSCLITRGSPQADFFGVNIFLRLSGESNAPALNAYDYVSDRLRTCSDFNNGIDVNLVYVDYWSIGDVLQATHDYNDAMAQERNIFSE